MPKDKREKLLDALVPTTLSGREVLEVMDIIERALFKEEKPIACVGSTYLCPHGFLRGQCNNGDCKPAPKLPEKLYNFGSGAGGNCGFVSKLEVEQKVNEIIDYLAAKDI